MNRLVYTKRARSFTLKIIFVSVLFLLISLLFFLFNKFEEPEIYDMVTADPYPDFTVVIDAGHGGIDGGAESEGVFEKDLNLSLSQKVSDFLSLYNVECVLTRNTDVLLSDDTSSGMKRSDLLNRVKFTNSYDNPIFVSIHMNKFPIEKYNGLQVFYSVNNTDSKLLADLVQDLTVTHVQPDNKRQTKPATTSIYVLDRLNCPAVLVECGFMSNHAELENLESDEYQNKLAFIISTAIIQFINKL